jgi:UDP-N-acetylmuramoyl-tripeptide--D-alanyl-D-alanine ligase
VRSWDARRLAEAAGAKLIRERGPERPGGPRGASADSRTVLPGELFVGLPGERSDGGAHAAQALQRGAWGVLVGPEHARAAAQAQAGGAVLAHPRPLAALHALAGAWLTELRAAGAQMVALTGSTGKTSTKDILAALLRAHLRTAASPANFNTEIGLPLSVLAAPAGSEALVLEMAMRGAGQIAELTAIAQPDVGVIVNVGPAHLELLGSLEAIAAAKAELIAGMPTGATAVLPAREPLLEAHVREDLRNVRFGQGGDVELLERRPDGGVVIRHFDERLQLWPSFAEEHNLRNLLAAVAAARALGVRPEGRLEVAFSQMRGERHELPGEVVVIDDCYNANPMSMRAAIDELSRTAEGRRVAVLGDMLELGGHAPRLHREIGEHAGARGIDVLVAVGEQAREIASSFPGEAHMVADAPAAAALLGRLVRAGDTVLVKGSRGIGLERAVAALRARAAREDREAEPVARGGPGQR